MTAPVFTVFTPTYNRAHTLDCVYASLIAQTFTDFEWLIVDDGSTDDTEALVRSYISENRIAIRYYRQPNTGKHVAFNRGVREALGNFLLPLDSDDSCTPNALERFLHHWTSIPEPHRASFSGITCLCKSERDELVGRKLPASHLDGHPHQMAQLYDLRGEKWGFHLTAILREHPFPNIEGERFAPEGLVWNRISLRYKIRFIDEALRIYHSSSDSLSAKSAKIRKSSPVATCMYYREAMNLPVRLSSRLKAATNLWRFALGSNRPGMATTDARNSFLFIVALLPGAGLALLDKIKGGIQN